MKICLIEDDLELGRALQGALHYDGHEVVWVRRLVDGEHRLQADLFDAVCSISACRMVGGLALSSAARASGRRAIGGVLSPDISFVPRNIANL